MIKQRIIWLLSFLGSVAFFIWYQQWLSQLLLGAVVLIPLFSLLVSLPSMITARLEILSPGRVTVGTPVTVSFRCVSKWTDPQWSGRLKIIHSMTGKRIKLRSGSTIPTDHSGILLCTLTHIRVYDHLGLIGLPVRGQRQLRVVVEPKPIPIPNEEEADANSVFAWKPKNGGFSEAHELRLYVPGDSLRQVHWKLTAKTGKLIIREPMIPDSGRVLVTLVLKGTPEELERLLGRALWLGQRLTEQQISFELMSMTGAGVSRTTVTSAQELQLAMDEILGSMPVTEGTLEPPNEIFTQQYTLGGAPDEE